jgi:hypothetical protein
MTTASLYYLPNPSGDTTGATDTSALNTAIAASGTGQTCIFGQGTYWINASIKFVGNRKYQGQATSKSTDGTIIKQAQNANIVSLLSAGSGVDDPTATLRHLRRWVRPGGVVAFKEITCHRARSVPEIPLMTDWVRWVSAGLSQAGADPDIGDRLPAILRDAGFGDVEAASVSIAGDGAGAIPTYLAQTVESLTPMILRSGTATTEDLDRDLAAVIAAQARERQVMLHIQELAAAWARVPFSPVAGAPGSAPGW